MNDLLVICPTRGRRDNAMRLLQSFEKNTVLNTTNLVFVTDPDDQETYEGVDWGEAQHGILDPREYLTGKLNRTVNNYIDMYDAIMFIADDHVFETVGWDDLMLRGLAQNGGTGMIYPDGVRRNDVPEIILFSTDIIKELGHFAEPTLGHYYLDNTWAELGKRSNLIHFMPEVKIPHLHYSVDEETQRDKTYSETEELLGERDRLAYNNWVMNIMPVQVSKLRRAFNPDVKWVLGRF